MSINISRPQIINSFLALFTGTVFTQLATIFTLLLTARALGVVPYGAYIACFALTRLMAVFFNSGVDVWLLRSGGAKSELLHESLGKGLLIKFFFGTIWLSGFAVAAVLLPGDLYPPDLLLVAAVTTFFEGLFATVLTGFKSQLKNKKTAFLSTGGAGSILVMTIFLFFGSYSPLQFAQARAVLTFGIFLVGFYFLYQEIKISFNLRESITILREIFPYMISDGFVAIYTSADIVIITIALGKAMVGFYGPVSNIINALFIVPQSIYTVMVPVISQLITSKHQALKRVTKANMLVSAGVGAVLWLGIGLFAQPIIWILLGQEYLESARILQILSAILFLKSCSFAMIAVLVSANLQKQRTVIQGVAAFLNVFLNIIFINRFGITGVAVIYIISEIALLAGYMLLVWGWERKSEPFSSSVLPS